MDINDIFERLFNYFQTSTIRELSEKINMSESTVSKWRQRESINAIKKKCRELGIYNEIFGDLASGTTINQGNGGRAGGRDYIENGNLKKEIEFDNITMGLIQKAIEKFGSEEEFQFQFMNFLRDK
jgi:hypothetical protein